MELIKIHFNPISDEKRGVDEKLQNILIKLEQTTNVAEVKQAISEIVTVYETSLENNIENPAARNLLIQFFTKFSNNKLVKKYLHDKLSKRKLIKQVIIHIRNEIIRNIETEKTCDVTQSVYLLNFIYFLHNDQDLTNYITETLFTSFYLILEGFVSHTRLNLKETPPNTSKLIVLINGVCQQILHVFKRDKSEWFINVISQQYSAKLILLCVNILKHQQIGFDLKTKCGLILIRSLNVLPKEFTVNSKHQELFCLEILDVSQSYWFLNRDDVGELLRNDNNKVVIYSAISSVLFETELFNCFVHNKPVFCILYEELLECAKRTTANPSQIIEVSRSLSLFNIKYLKLAPTESILLLFSEGLAFVVSHIEHFIDTVRNYSEIFFVHLTTLAAYHMKHGNFDLINILLDSMKKTLRTHSFRFKAMINVCDYFGCDFLLEKFENLQKDLLNLTLHVSVGEQAMKTYIHLMVNHHHESWFNIWVKPVADIIKFELAPKFHQDIVIKAFSLDPNLVSSMIEPLEESAQPQEIIVILKGLKVLRTNLEHHEYTNETKWRDLISKEQLDNFKIHQNEEIRVSTLELVVECPKTTELFLEWELDFLLSYLKYNLTCPIPSIRKQIITFYKKAFRRFEASYNVILRNMKNLQKGQPAKTNELDTLTKQKIFYNTFLTDCFKLLLLNLSRDANYLRRSSSLELLLLVQPLLRKDDWLNGWSEESVNNCQNILFDTYEANKKMAVGLLRGLPPNLLGLSNKESTQQFLDTCIEMATDIKPSKTLSAAYMFEICATSPYLSDINPIQYLLGILTNILKQQGSKELDVTDTKSSYYGIILTIRHLLENRQITDHNESYSILFDDLVNICLRIKDHIMPLVCNPSPEGHLPSDCDEKLETDESAKAQMVLVYAWRTMKEMTLLLAEIITQTIKLEKTTQMLSDDLLLTVGEFFVQVFIESKHRGVFEQAYVGFSVICDSFWTTGREKINILPEQWLHEVLSFCTGEKQCFKLCATRRSAGLPFLILSLLTTEPTNEKSNFHYTVTKLLLACENTETTNDECRMHCMNVLRAIYRHSKLGELVSPYVARGVIVAITGFESSSWSVRNSATLLYSSLITRMFGVQRTQDSEQVCLKNRLTVNVFLMRYPELFNFLFETLKIECDKSDSLLLHPILMILARLYPSHALNYNMQIQKYLPYITICLANKVYRTRELAARASVPLLSDTNLIVKSFGKIFNDIRIGNMSENELHGHLLQMWHVLKSNNIPELPVESYLRSSLHLLNDSGKIHSHMTIALYMQIVTLFLIRYKKCNDTCILLEVLKNLSGSCSATCTSKAKYPQNKFNLIIFIVLCKLPETQLTYTVITDQIILHLTGPDYEMKLYVLQFLIYLNKISNKSHYEHPLYYTGELEIPETISDLISCLNLSTRWKLLHETCSIMRTFYQSSNPFKNCNVYSLLLLNYYPCVIKKLCKTEQETFNQLLKLCNGDDEQLTSAALSCVSTVLSSCTLQAISFQNLLDVLAASASPAAADYRRLSACKLLTRNWSLFQKERQNLQEKQLCEIYNIIMVLLEDDDLMVRNAMSEVVSCKQDGNYSKPMFCPFISEKVKEEILFVASNNLPSELAVGFIFSWLCRSFPTYSNDASEIFERGELNLYAENLPIFDVGSKLLKSVLCSKPKTNMKDITSKLLEGVTQFPFAILDGGTKKEVMKSLLDMDIYLRETTDVHDFFKQLQTTFLPCLKGRIGEHTFYTVKRLFIQVYEDFF